MTRPLIVSVAHGLDFLTFTLALSAFGIAGEANGLMGTVYVSAGLLGILALKASGTLGLACITQMRPWALVPAAGAGIFGAAVNLAALGVLA